MSNSEFGATEGNSSCNMAVDCGFPGNEKLDELVEDGRNLVQHHRS